MNKNVGALRMFFGTLLTPEGRAIPCDHYAPMFIADITCFLIIIFGYSSFGTDSSGGDVTAYFSENKVPGTLVSMLIIQFVLIIFDRALFLRKFLIGKIFFQIFLIIFVHIWMFFYLPAATDRLFINNTTCKFWYFSKVIYFIISAKQIRSGYPKRSIGNIMTNSYSRINLYLYQLFMMVPFLFELRCLMDWIWKDTALDVGDWFLFNEIFSHISMLKCSQKVNQEQIESKSSKKVSLEKYVKGGILLVIIVFLIWFPLVLFSMANTVGFRSLPVECSVQLTISGFQPLYESTAQLGNIRHLSEEEYERLQFPYRLSKGAQSYMSDYECEDVVKAEINGNSTSRWMISPPSRQALIAQLEHQPKVDFKFSWFFKRAPDPNLQFGVAEDFRILSLNSTHPARQHLINMLKGEHNATVRIPNVFPALMKVPPDGKADAVGALLGEHAKSGTPINNSFSDILLSLNKEESHEWWTVKMIDRHFDPVKITEEEVLNGIIVYGFVDKVFSTSFLVQFLTGGGILGLYLSLVLLVGKFMRDMATGSMPKIMFDQLPNVDDILQMCLDIMLVREAGEMELEEELFGRLIFLFRSPALLIKMTRDKGRET
ncbi:unnamed protein product, partial [Mesorhabditis belari]|uniref:Piezo non-specific cation channel R-Ras-binding domain-containing protein n=1 Tax=Mesorhabditis belari TaxID=2138241 RepID=A0AAF3J481_9BILA